MKLLSPPGRVAEKSLEISGCSTATCHAGEAGWGFKTSPCSGSWCWLFAVVLGLSSDSTCMFAKTLKSPQESILDASGAHPRRFPPEPWVQWYVTAVSLWTWLWGYSSAACDPANRARYVGSSDVPLLESKFNYTETENSVPSP